MKLGNMGFDVNIDDEAFTSAPYLLVVGTGLIGGSLALSLKQYGQQQAHQQAQQQAVATVLGVARTQKSLGQAQALGIIDQGFLELESALQSVALEKLPKEGWVVVVLATPVAQTAELLKKIIPYWHPRLIVTDVGSTKKEVVQLASQVLADFPDCLQRFVPAHPIAGSHETGPAAAKANLFHQKQVIITPLSETAAHVQALKLIQLLWEKTGAHVATMPAAEHDALYAKLSHFPHWLAMVMMEHVLHDLPLSFVQQYAGSGFKDFTRIAASSPSMWHAIFESNRDEMLSNVDGFIERLQAWRQHLLNDSDELLKAIDNASQSRQQI